MRCLDAGCTPGFAPGDRFGHQPIFLRLGDDIGFSMMVPVISVIMTVVDMVVMRLMFVMPMIVMIMPGDASQTIGAALGLKGCRDEADLGTKLLDQFDEHVIIAHTQRIGQQLRRRVPVAEVPGNARDHMRVRRPELDQTLRLALDRDDRAGFQLEPVAVDQRRRFGEVDEEFGPLRARQGAAPPAAIVEIKFDGVGHAGGIIATGCEGLGRSNHGCAVSRVWSRQHDRRVSPFATALKRVAQNADRAALPD